MALMRHALQYHHDSARLFACIAHKPWAMFLDSGQMLDPHTGKAGSQYGRYDILVAEPFAKMVGNERETSVLQRFGCVTREDDPFKLLKEELRSYQVEKSDLPFTGGALGFFSYDLARRIETLPRTAAAIDASLLLQVGLYDWAVVVDHRRQTAELVSNWLVPETRENWKALCAMFDKASTATPKQTSFEVTTPISSNMDKAAYASAFQAIKNYIKEGDCYQVNLAQRFSAQARGDAWVAYQKLREVSPAPFMAYLNFGNVKVVSGSPERFLQVVNSHVETRPIKGTRPRAEDAERDQALAAELQASAKDKAENLMIVDLLRNDIGKSCEIGSVKAEQLFQLQSFANVHHLVSIVTGKLAQGKTAVDLLRGCFPGGSITGAPKLRAMQIIEALEPHRRGVYCGAIGYIGFDGSMDTNIAIRTAVFAPQKNDTGEISFYAGGGIVADSDLEKEYTETWDKAASMLKVMRHFMSPEASEA